MRRSGAVEFGGSRETKAPDSRTKEIMRLPMSTHNWDKNRPHKDLHILYASGDRYMRHEATVMAPNRSDALGEVRVTKVSGKR